MTKFLRRNWNVTGKIGKGRRKKQIWRSPKGRDNKMREKRRGYPVVVSVGYKKEKKLRGKIENKKVSIIKNIKHLVKAKKDELIILGKIGKKKRIEIAKIAKENNLNIHNLNINKFLEKIEKSKEKKSEKDTKKTEKQKEDIGGKK